MGTRDARVNAYIARSADFAKPILTHLGELIHHYSNKKEYVDWLTEAKTEETESKRLATAIEWMSEGKTRNWKYVKR